MTIQDYLHRLKQWRQQLCVDRLILLVLVLTNALLLIHCLNRKPAVEMTLPFMDGQIGIHSGEASQVYYEWWGLSLAELLGNLNPQNLSFVESRLQSLLSPNLYQQVHETLNQQFHQLREDLVSLSFEPLQLEFDETTHEVRVTGNSALSSGHQRLSGQKTFTFQFNLIRYRPVLAAIQIDCGIPGYRARIRPIVSRITIHWPSFYNVVTGKTLALPNLIALQHIPLSPAGVIAKRPAPIALPNSCAAEWRMAPDAVFSPYASVRYFTPHMVHSQYNLL